MRLLRALLALPLILLFPISDRRTVLLDVGRWAAIDGGVRDAFDSPPGTLADMLYLLGKYPEFRSLFYARVSRRGLPGRIAARVMALFWKGAPGLLIGPAEIGPGLFIEHGFGTIMAADFVGRDCWINQDVTLASNRVKGGCVLGDRVYVRMGAKVLGGTTIGDDCEIGANAVVTKDIPAGQIAVGVPARPIGANPRTSAGRSDDRPSPDRPDHDRTDPRQRRG